MSDKTVLNVMTMGFPWQTLDPFLFCVHHLDAYPEGDAQMAPRASLAGRRIGMDFSGKDGWSMYHGDRVPGFPRHPHRGFETITIARQGFIDHSDSLGATARFGRGDVQWMTAGSGVVHSEMFPLLDQEGPNTTELFQIWLNLPRASKDADAHFAMLWGDQIPRTTLTDDDGRSVELEVIAGRVGDWVAPQPPPDSWASNAEAHVAIWALKLAPGARWTAPAAIEGLNRVFYVFAGDAASVAGVRVPRGQAAQVRSEHAAELVNVGDGPLEILMLQGRPIGEPVVQHGPFVANSRAGIQQAIMGYQRTGFGGWPWGSDGPVHPRDKGRFAVHVDGREERPG